MVFTIKMQADTGADVTVIGVHTWKLLESPILCERKWQLWQVLNLVSRKMRYPYLGYRTRRQTSQTRREDVLFVLEIIQWNIGE